MYQYGLISSFSQTEYQKDIDNLSTDKIINDILLLTRLIYSIIVIEILENVYE